jgi:hypothetical protein
MLYEVSKFSVYGQCICVWLMYVCMPQCVDYVLDNLWCSNSKNLDVFMFLPIFYVVFHPFSSMLTITHIQSIYHMYKVVTTISTIFVHFLRFFFALQAPKSIESILFQNRSGKLAKLVSLLDFGSVYQYDSNFWPIWILCQFSTGFRWNWQNQSGPVFKALPIFESLISTSRNFELIKFKVHIILS